jgi:glycosyltransferase involved in cell wall biosynthesis
MLSIIIITLNEENYLPHLLNWIKEQNFKDYEVIISDAGSKDRTIEIAKDFGCKVVSGGLPAKGRNQGAKLAQGDLLLFLDADIILPKNSLEKLLKEFEDRNLKVAGSFLQSQSENKIVRFVYHLVYNWPILFFEQVLPHASSFILIKKDLHQKIKGFDEEIKLSEDHCYVREASKLGKFGILRSIIVFVSSRRFEQEGWIKTTFKFLLCELHMTFIGPVKTDIFKYHFDPYQKDKKLKKSFRISEIIIIISLAIFWMLMLFPLFLIGAFYYLRNKIKFILKKRILRTKNLN